jgi:hypothetical protein
MIIICCIIFFLLLLLGFNKGVLPTYEKISFSYFSYLLGVTIALWSRSKDSPNYTRHRRNDFVQGGVELSGLLVTVPPRGPNPVNTQFWKSIDHKFHSESSELYQNKAMPLSSDVVLRADRPRAASYVRTCKKKHCICACLSNMLIGLLHIESKWRTGQFRWNGMPRRKTCSPELIRRLVRRFLW